MPEEFCKIFESKVYGQILVTKDTTVEDGHPQVSVKFIPKGLGVCGPDFAFSDEDEMVAWEKVDSLFDKIDLEQAEVIAKNVNNVCMGITD